MLENVFKCLTSFHFNCLLHKLFHAYQTQIGSIYFSFAKLQQSICDDRPTEHHSNIYITVLQLLSVALLHLFSYLLHLNAYKLYELEKVKRQELP